MWTTTDTSRTSYLFTFLLYVGDFFRFTLFSVYLHCHKNRIAHSFANFCAFMDIAMLFNN